MKSRWDSPPEFRLIHAASADEVRGRIQLAERFADDFRVVRKRAFGTQRSVRLGAHAGNHDDIPFTSFIDRPLNCFLAIQDDLYFVQFGESQCELPGMTDASRTRRGGPW